MCAAPALRLLALLVGGFALAGPAAGPRTLYEWVPDGGMRLNVTGNDPQFDLPGLVPKRLPAGATLTVRLSATAGREIQVFWGGDYSEADSLRLPLTADGKPHDYIFRWPRTVTIERLRLDPTDAPSQVHVERAVITASAAPEIGFGAVYMDRVLPRAGRPWDGTTRTT